MVLFCAKTNILCIKINDLLIKINRCRRLRRMMLKCVGLKAKTRKKIQKGEVILL